MNEDLGYGYGAPRALMSRPQARKGTLKEKSLYNGNSVRRSVIDPSKRSRTLLRQMSALGMEDPVYGTQEAGPTHPSNIFDDMSVGDLPEDMRDMVSVASDPTADGTNGLDMEHFQESLGDLHLSSSNFSGMELNVPQNNILSAPESPRTVETTGSSSTPSFPDAHGLPASLKPSQKNSPNQVDEQPWDELAATSNHSIGLEELAGPEKPKRKSGRKPTRSKGRGAEKMHQSMSSMSETGNLLMQCALALEKDGNANKDLIVAAMHNSMSEFSSFSKNTNYTASTDEDGVRRKAPARSRSGNRRVPRGEAKAAPLLPVVPSDAERRRVMPSLVGLFPQEQNAKRTRSRSNKSGGARKARVQKAPVNHSKSLEDDAPASRKASLDTTGRMMDNVGNVDDSKADPKNNRSRRR